MQTIRFPTTSCGSLIDTHCHLDLDVFAPDRDAVMRATQAAGVADLVIPGIDAAGWSGLLALCATFDAERVRCHPALGLHPLYLERHREPDLNVLERLVGERKTLAIGEIGLDFWDRDIDRSAQQRLFEAQLMIAREADLPVLLHVRKAHDQVLAMLERIRVRGGIAHAFNGSEQQARRYGDLGFMLGFGGMLTFERSTRLRRLAAALPIEQIVLETDAPDMTVVAHQGERNSPEYLPDILCALAEVRDLEPASLARQTTANARAVLRIH